MYIVKYTKILWAKYGFKTKVKQVELTKQDPVVKYADEPDLNILAIKDKVEKKEFKPKKIELKKREKMQTEIDIKDLKTRKDKNDKKTNK